MNLTLSQKIAMVSIVLGALAGGAAQLTPLFGASVASSIASVASLANTIISGWIFIVTGQQNQVKNVLAMPGVEAIGVNKTAGPVLAALAVDPEQPKIAAIPKDLQAVAETANKAGG